MAEGKNTVVVYKDWRHIFDKLSDAEAGILIKHFFNYINDMDPEPPDRITELTFEPIKQQLKRDLKLWEKKKSGNSVSGRIGNLKRWYPDLYKKYKSGSLDLKKAIKIAEDRNRDEIIANDRERDENVANDREKPIANATERDENVAKIADIDNDIDIDNVLNNLYYLKSDENLKNVLEYLKADLIEISFEDLQAEAAKFITKKEVETDTGRPFHTYQSHFINKLKKDYEQGKHQNSKGDPPRGGKVKTVGQKSKTSLEW